MATGFIKPDLVLSRLVWRLSFIILAASPWMVAKRLLIERKNFNGTPASFLRFGFLEASAAAPSAGAADGWRLSISSVILVIKVAMSS